MKIYVGLTDKEWFDFLRELVPPPEDVNFWQPGGTPFKVITTGAPFLFKLKAPFHAIGGIGFFVQHSILPLSMAWDTFGERNGCSSYAWFRSKILHYRNRKGKTEVDPMIGNVVLTNPVFFREEDWIPVEDSWAGIMQGRSYDTSVAEGLRLWERVEAVLQKYSFLDRPAETRSPLEPTVPIGPNDYREVLSRVRVGQGAFRVQIIDAYNRRCAITGEKTLPALEASHIQPYSDEGPHRVSNGILLRSDIHNLFDKHYITITPELRVEVSQRIKEEFQNGKEYYRFHGGKIQNLPEIIDQRPARQYLEWHNNLFRGNS